MALTYEDILASLQADFKEGSNPEAKTSKEWADEWGITYHRALEVLNKLQAAGRVKVERVHRPRLDGLTKTVSVFTIEPEHGKDRKNKRKAVPAQVCRSSAGTRRRLR